jgi:hypothetical protein
MFLLLSRLLRVLLVLVVARLLARAFAAWRRGRGSRLPQTEAPRGQIGELVRDRVCNTFVPREKALEARVEGRIEHFCSPACRDRALAAAARTA